MMVPDDLLIYLNHATCYQLVNIWVKWLSLKWTARLKHCVATCNSNDWRLASRVLQTRAFETSHTAYLAELLTEAIQEWELPNKDPAIVMDNALNMVRAVELMGLFCAHAQLSLASSSLLCACLADYGELLNVFLEYNVKSQTEATKWSKGCCSCPQRGWWLTWLMWWPGDPVEQQDGDAGKRPGAANSDLCSSAVAWSAQEWKPSLHSDRGVSPFDMQGKVVSLYPWDQCLLGESFLNHWHIFTAKRSCLTPQHVYQLLFLQKNLKISNTCDSCHGEGAIASWT